MPTAAKASRWGFALIPPLPYLGTGSDLLKCCQRTGLLPMWVVCVLGCCKLLSASALVQACSPALMEGGGAMQVMADVFALQRIQSDVMFRNDDYVAAEKVKAINRLLEHLRMEMRSQAVPLVDAFNIPDHILRAPIGLQSQDYTNYVEIAGWSPVM